MDKIHRIQIEMPRFDERGDAWSSAYTGGFLGVQPVWPILLLLAPKYDEVSCYFLEFRFQETILPLEDWNNLNYTSGFLCSSGTSNPGKPVVLAEQDFAYCFCHSGFLAAFGGKDHVRLLSELGRCGQPDSNRTWLSRWVKECKYILEAGHDGQFLLCYSSYNMDPQATSAFRSAVLECSSK